MSQMFNNIRVANTKRSTFDLSHTQITTSDFGYLLPVCIRDMVPNDDFVVTPDLFCRAAPAAVPFYGRIKIRVHHFFVPYRILYPYWDSFITQDPNNNTLPPYYEVSTLRQALNTDPQFSPGQGLTLPRGTYGRLMSAFGINAQSIRDSMGLDGNDRISAFPFLAYYRIWLDWFMDSSIYDHAAYDLAFKQDIANGGNLALATNYLLTRNCCFKKDYFTTARLSPQGGSVNPNPYTVDPSRVGVDIADPSLNPGLSTPSSQGALNMNNSRHVYQSGSSQISNATNKIGQFTIEALRAANSLQRYLERNNFVGSKIINRILAHFGVSPTPERLDMAEFIDGDSFDLRVGDVTSTASASQSTAGLGYQAGKAVAGAHSKTVRYHAKEHGVFMSLMSILPDTSYYQGISRMFQKGVYGDALDYYTPEFENLGYQEILNKEVYIPTAPESASYQNYDPDGVFGYTPRYSEYKFQNDILSGDFLGFGSVMVMGSQLDSWHLFRKLSFDDNNPLALNENFVELNNHNNNYDRVFQFTNTDYDHFYFNIFFDVKATRPMTGFTAPSLDGTNEGDGNSINLPYGGTRL